MIALMCGLSRERYSATGHSTDNISILHQQVRCTNLAWALVRLRHVKYGSVVGIVGGSFSGLMLAVSLALQRRCIVYNGIIRRRNAARETITDAANQFAIDRPPRPDKNSMLAKHLYLGAFAFPNAPYLASDPILSDPENWLRDRLRHGGPVTYTHSEGAHL